MRRETHLASREARQPAHWERLAPQEVRLAPREARLALREARRALQARAAARRAFLAGRQASPKKWAVCPAPCRAKGKGRSKQRHPDGAQLPMIVLRTPEVMQIRP